MNFRGSSRPDDHRFALTIFDDPDGLAITRLVYSFLADLGFARRSGFGPSTSGAPPTPAEKLAPIQSTGPLCRTSRTVASRSDSTMQPSASGLLLGLVTLSFVFWIFHSFGIRSSIEAVRLALTKHGAGF